MCGFWKKNNKTKEANWIGHILSKKLPIKHVIEGKIGKRRRITRGRGRKCNLMDVLCTAILINVLSFNCSLYVLFHIIRYIIQVTNIVCIEYCQSLDVIPLLFIHVESEGSCGEDVC